MRGIVARHSGETASVQADRAGVHARQATDLDIRHPRRAVQDIGQEEAADPPPGEKFFPRCAEDIRHRRDRTLEVDARYQDALRGDLGLGADGQAVPRERQEPFPALMTIKDLNPTFSTGP